MPNYGEEKRLVLRHSDEYYSNGKVHLVKVKYCGTDLELMDKTPELKRRAYFRSGLSNVVITLEQFPEWFQWFQDRVLHGESYELRLEDSDPDLVSTLDEMEVEYEAPTQSI